MRIKTTMITKIRLFINQQIDFNFGQLMVGLDNVNEKTEWSFALLGFCYSILIMLFLKNSPESGYKPTFTLKMN